MLRVHDQEGQLYATKAHVLGPTLPQFAKGIPGHDSVLCLSGLYRLSQQMQKSQVNFSHFVVHAGSLAVSTCDSSDTTFFSLFFLVVGGLTPRIVTAGVVLDSRR